MSRIAEKDPRVAQLIAECERHGIVHDIGIRWEQGIPHHPKAFEIFEMLEKSDWAFGDDYFCWKSGGDGDNGETLMYSLSVYLELRDAVKSELDRNKIGGDSLKHPVHTKVRVEDKI